MKQLISMTARALLAGACALLMLGCVPKQESANSQSQVQSDGASSMPQARTVDVAFVLTDLGLEDGQFARLADEAFSELDSTVINYTVIGEMPDALANEAGIYDIGLPKQNSGEPGEMTLSEAEALLADVTKAGWLVLSSASLLDSAFSRIDDGTLSVELILVLDDYGLLEPPTDPPVPVYVISYDITPVAFLLGIAAAESSNNGMFVVMASEDDPQADDFLDAVWTGAKYHTNGAQVADAVLPTDDVSGLVTPEIFRQLHVELRRTMGQHFAANHYILSLGRATPSILYACASKPIDGYVAGGYADFRQVRASRVIGCAEKRPDAALRWIFSQLADEGLAALADESGYINVGLEEEAVSFTDFEMYSRYNPDGDDITEAIENVWAEICADELDVDKLIERFRGKESTADNSEEPAV